MKTKHLIQKNWVFGVKYNFLIQTLVCLMQTT